MFSEHNRIKLVINNNMTFWKTTEVIENPSHLFSEEITKEIIKHFELDKNEE